MSKRSCCWGGHLFANNVGVLPRVPDGCTLSPRLVLSIPTKVLGCPCKLSQRRRRLQYLLITACCPNVTRDVAPTVDARVED